jgi:hypothetical protein
MMVSDREIKPKLDQVSSLGRGFRLLLLGLVLARGLVYLCVIPPFEGWDEYQHVAYVTHILETGQPAVFGKTEVPHSLLKAMLPAFPQPLCALQQLDARQNALGYEAYWSRQAVDPSPLPPCDPAAAGIRLKLYQAQHSWWYYALVTPLFAGLGGVNDLRRSVGGLRLANLLLTVAAVWVFLEVVDRRVRSRRIAAWIGLAIAAQPLFLLNVVRVSSDALGVLLATLVMALAIGVNERRMTLRMGLMGVLAGMAILTKATNWSLAPILAASWIFAIIRNRPTVLHALAAGATAAVGLAMMVGPEIAYNMATYGLPSPMQEAIVNSQHGRGPGTLLHLAGIYSWTGMARWMWLQGVLIRGGWSLIAPFKDLVKFYYWAAVAGILGWAWWLAQLGIGHGLSRVRGRYRWDVAKAPRAIFDSLWTPTACVVFCASVTGALGYHAIQSFLAWGQSTTCAWYTAAALPWFQILAVRGALAWPSNRLAVNRKAVATSRRPPLSMVA